MVDLILANNTLSNFQQPHEADMHHSAFSTKLPDVFFQQWTTPEFSLNHISLPLPLFSSLTHIQQIGQDTISLCQAISWLLSRGRVCHFTLANISDLVIRKQK